ncbi:MAG: ribbon-helix-helix protein, CopG family [Ardenticatenia bacterium]|nr:ribbon-helix-helix protein, CopG family [Ardenticatenia bacterium]
MTQLAVYLDDETASLLEEAARRAKISRSSWVREAIQSHLRNRLPEFFFATLGTWEDERDPAAILRDIRADVPQAERVGLD